MVEHGIDKIVFSSTALHMESQKVYLFWKRIVHFQQTVMVKQSCQWKKCLNGHLRRITYDMFHFGIFNACGAHPNGKIGEAHNPETHLIPLVLQVRTERENTYLYLEMIMTQRMEPV